MSKSCLTLAALFAATVIVGTGVSVILAVPPSGHMRNTGATFILILALAVSGGQLVMTTVAARPATASMVAHLFFVFFLIIPALFQVSTGSYAWDMVFYNEDTATIAAILVLLFVVSYVLGGTLEPKDLKRQMQTVLRCERRRRRAIVIGFVLFSIVVSIGAIHSFGINTLLSNRAPMSAMSVYVEQETTTDTGLFLDLPRVLSFCGLLALLYLLGQKCGSYSLLRQTGTLLLTLLIAPLFALLNYPLAQARYWLFGMAIVVFLMYVDLQRIRARLMLVVGMGWGAYTIFPLATVLTTRGTLSFDVEVRSMWAKLFTADFDGFEMVMNIVVVADRFGYTWGNQLLSAALFFVPRSLWHEKALPTGTYAATNLGHAFTNLSAPIMGELYLDFSYLGVILGGIAIGYLYSKADTVFAAALAYGGISLHRVIVAVVCGFTIILMRGALLSIIAMFATCMASVAFLITAPWLTSLLFDHREAQTPALTQSEPVPVASANDPFRRVGYLAGSEKSGVSNKGATRSETGIVPRSISRK